MTTPRVSSGLLMYRLLSDGLQVLLVHPGGPYFRHKDGGAWSIPKGEIETDEEPLNAALREFQEELGIAPRGPYLKLTPVEQRGGKVVQAWAFEGDCDPTRIISNRFSLEWPPHSGQTMEFPEIDQAAFFELPTARQKINPAQVALIDELETLLNTDIRRP